MKKAASGTPLFHLCREIHHEGMAKELCLQIEAWIMMNLGFCAGGRARSFDHIIWLDRNTQRDRSACRLRWRINMPTVLNFGC